MKVTMTEAERLLGIDSNEYGVEDIEKLESFIIDCNSAANAPEGGTLVADAVYDTLLDRLREVKPDSELLVELWTDEGDITDYSDHLKKHPMMSIQTVKSWDDINFSRFVDAVEETSSEDGASVFMSYKLDGHGIRVVYENGNLVLATSRARASAGRDLTRQLRNILGEHNEGLAEFGLVEIRGELCLPLDQLDAAREFNPDIKSAFSGVSSMVRPKSTAAENKLLHFLAYRALSDSLYFTYKSEEYQELESWGFRTPSSVVVEIDTSAEDIETELRNTVESLEEDYQEYNYFCDGVIAEIDSRDEFNSLDTTGIRSMGNIALKVNSWGQDLYQGFVQYILWTEGKSKFSPVAIVADEPNKAILTGEDGWLEAVNFSDLGVLTVAGNTVRRVPLYEPRNILILEAYPGRPLSFRYGGEAGVVPCTMKGELLTDDAVRAKFTQDGTGLDEDD